jgi:glycosidase
MSKNTSNDLRKLFFYQVYIRNHTSSGSFKGLIKDLDRIKDLGVDYVYLLPIHEIGIKNKKGDLGCPYSIKDYRSINHEYGTLDDFKNLIEETHKRNMKLMLDVVFNHTSYDSILIEEHPEYFYKKNGEFANRIGDWWDITDLDYTVSKDLWTELIDTLVYWTNFGVDGFRWDVASLLPLEFLEEAHERVLDVNPNSVFLSESVHGGFCRYIRQQGFGCLSESEIYQVFDMSYDYDTHPYFEGYLKGENSFDKYLDSIDRQEEIYPENYVKLRNLENHDFGRFAPMVNSDLEKIQNWTCMSFFLKGSTLIYAGQENCDINKPSLFDKDNVNWAGKDISPLIKKLSSIVKDDCFSNGYFSIIRTSKDVFVGLYEYKNTKTYGIFNVSNNSQEINLDIELGTYINLLDGNEIFISSNDVKVDKIPMILRRQK